MTSLLIVFFVNIAQAVRLPKPRLSTGSSLKALKKQSHKTSARAKKDFRKKRTKRIRSRHTTRCKYVLNQPNYEAHSIL